MASLRNDDSDLVYQPSVSRQYGLEPKLKKIITFYKFIFFTLSDECRKDNNFEDNDWRKHITPLPKSYEKDTCLLGDLIPRIPLSVFVKTVFITYVIPGLDELLKDPIRRHHTLQMLPHDLIKNLFRKRKYIFCMVELLTLLAHLNLVELSSKLLSIKEQVLVRLLKTTEFTEEDYVKKYRLRNLNDVEMFVNDLELHGSRTDCKKCSFDSRLYIHNARNWSYQPKFLRNVPANELNRFARLRDLNDESMNNLNNLDVSEIAPTATFKTPAVKRKAQKQASKRSTKRARMLSGISGHSEDLDDDQAEDEADGGTPTRPRRGRKLTKQLRRNGYDKEDMNALSLLRKQRSEWSKEEDSFLLMCRVASILIHPTSIHFTCVSKNVLRDELMKYLPQLAFDKTSKACQRRLMYMLRNPRTRSHVLDWVAEVKQDPAMSQIQKPDVPITHTEEWTACFIDLLHRLLAKFQNKEHFASPSAQIEQFKSLDEIYSTYNLIESEIHCVPQKPILFFQPNNTVDIYVNVVLNVLSSSLLANMFDSDPDAVRLTLTLFKIYQRYPDTMIRAVVNKMKINGMIAKIRAADRAKAKHSKDKKLSMFKISQHYCYVLKSRYAMDTLAVPLALKEFEKVVIREDCTSNQIALLTNLITMDRAMFNINVPENFVAIKDIARATCDEPPSPDKSMNCDQSTTTTNDEPDILANDLWSNDGSTQFEGSVSLNSAISQAKRTSRYVLCSLRQRMTLIDKYQLSQDYLVLNKCNIACRVSSTENLVNLDRFEELLERQKQLVHPERPVNEAQLNSTERTIVREVTKARELGLSYRQLFEANQIRVRNKTKESVARYAIQGLLEKQILFEVGVEEVKLVTYKFIMPWLVHAQMLVRGDEMEAIENEMIVDETAMVENPANINENPASINEVPVNIIETAFCTNENPANQNAADMNETTNEEATNGQATMTSSQNEEHATNCEATSVDVEMTEDHSESTELTNGHAIDGDNVASNEIKRAKVERMDFSELNKVVMNGESNGAMIGETHADQAQENRVSVGQENPRTESQTEPPTGPPTEPQTVPQSQPQTESTPAHQNGSSDADGIAPVTADEANNSENESNQVAVKPKLIYYVPKFWKTPLGQLDKNVLEVLMSGILGHIMDNPGITEDDLVTYFKFCLPPVQTLEILELLASANCIVKQERTAECNYTLFGGCDTIVSTFYEPGRNAFITYCCVKKFLSTRPA